MKTKHLDIIIESIRKELKQASDEKTRQSFQRFFKENVTYYGVKTGGVGKIAKNYWEKVKNLSKIEIFYMCEELYKNDFCEEAFVVSYWVPNLAKSFVKEDFGTFEKWIARYINNWAKCDGFCNHTVGDFIEMYPEYIKKLKEWTKSKNRWVKRAAAVSLIVPAKSGKYLKDAFEISELLLTDQDDMVQKGYGWLLKEESRKHEKEVFDFVTKHKAVMPRTAYRYAIELMQPALKAAAMKK